jgi:hypothetical protein
MSVLMCDWRYAVTWGTRVALASKLNVVVYGRIFMHKNSAACCRGIKFISTWYACYSSLRDHHDPLELGYLWCTPSWPGSQKFACTPKCKCSVSLTAKKYRFTKPYAPGRNRTPPLLDVFTGLLLIQKR